MTWTCRCGRSLCTCDVIADRATFGDLALVVLCTATYLGAFAWAFFQ